MSTLEELCEAHGIGFHVFAGDSSPQRIGTPTTQAQLRFKSAEEYADFSSNPRLASIAELFIQDRVRVLGDPWPLFEMAAVLDDQPPGLITKAWFSLRSVLSVLASSRKNRGAADKYRWSPGFYERFLGKHMQYTCAFWPRELPPRGLNDGLDEAQEAKFGLIAEKTKIQPQDAHLDIGCGWGGLASHFGHNYGSVSVGLTKSAEQRDFAQFRMVPAETARPPVFLQADYADYVPSAPVDIVTVVGMFEHVPYLDRQAFLRRVHKTLKSGGRFYLQTIARPENQVIGGDGSRFLRAHVYPGYVVETRSKLEDRLHSVGFKCRWQSPDGHADYARTARCWVDRLWDARDEAVSEVGQRAFNIELAYLGVGSAFFREHRGSLLRFVLEKP